MSKNYYYWINQDGRLTLELSDQKSLEECIGITLSCINQINSLQIMLPKYDSKLSRKYFSPNTDPQKAHKDGFNLAIRELKKAKRFNGQIELPSERPTFRKLAPAPPDQEDKE